MKFRDEHVIKNPRNFGEARNGIQIGSGYDVEIIRVDDYEGVARVTWGENEEYFSQVTIEPDSDLDSLAARWGSCPGAFGLLDDEEQEFQTELKATWEAWHKQAKS